MLWSLVILLFYVTLKQNKIRQFAETSPALCQPGLQLQ
jgi:hypothetical protein